MVIAVHAKDLEGALLAGGIMGHMALQVILNIAVVTNTIPNTGICNLLASLIALISFNT